MRKEKKQTAVKSKKHTQHSLISPNRSQKTPFFEEWCVLNHWYTCLRFSCHNMMFSFAHKSMGAKKNGRSCSQDMCSILSQLFQSQHVFIFVFWTFYVFFTLWNVSQVGGHHWQLYFWSLSSALQETNSRSLFFLFLNTLVRTILFLFEHLMFRYLNINPPSKKRLPYTYLIGTDNEVWYK